MKICCFAGHNIFYGDEIKERLYKKCEELVLQGGVTEFWVGNYSRFDAQASSAVLELKKIYPHLRLVLLLPYLTQEINSSREYYYQRYDSLLIADIPENTPARLRIIEANRYMIDMSDYIICYVAYRQGGAAKTLAYAEKCGRISITNLYG